MPSPRNLDQAFEHLGGADHQSPVPDVEMNTVVADQHGVSNLPGAPCEDEIEGEARFAGAGRTADQDGATARADR